MDSNSAIGWPICRTAIFKAPNRLAPWAEQNAFPDGMPVLKDANGNPVKDQFGNPVPDTNAIINTGFKLGGYDYAKGLMPFLQGRGVSARQDQIDTGVQGYGTPNPGADNKSAAGPGNILPQSPGAGQPPPRLAANGGDVGNGPGADNVRSLATERGIDVDAFVKAYPGLAGREDLALAPSAAKAVAARMAAFKEKQPVRSSEDVTPRPEDSGANERAMNGPSAAPNAASGVSGAPGPAAASNRSAITATAPVEAALSDLPSNEAVLRAVGAVLPPGVAPENYQGYVRALDRAVQSTLTNAYQASLLPNGNVRATQLQEKAKQYAAIRDKVLDAAKAAAEPTGPMKEWLAGRQRGETQAQYEARVVGGKKAATAPYEIAEAALREGGRPVAIHPNEVVTTGAEINPELKGFTGWAAGRLGLPSEAAAAPNVRPAPGVPGTSAAPLPGPASSVPGQSAFTPQMIRNPDGSVTSSVTPSTETLQKTAAQNYEKARETYNGAQQTKQTLAEMEDSFRSLNSAGWSSTGAGAEARLGMARAINSVWQVLGVKGESLPFDPEKIASWEDLQKNSTRLGFSLARTLGAREAMQIVQGAIKANPSVQNTPKGALMVLNTIRQNAERDNDYFEFATRYAQTHGGDLIGAEVAFNKQNPPSLYARRAIVQAQKNIPQEAIDDLRNNPRLAESFDKKFGGKGAAKTFLPQGSAP